MSEGLVERWESHLDRLEQALESGEVESGLPSPPIDGALVVTDLERLERLQERTRRLSDRVRAARSEVADLIQDGAVLRRGSKTYRSGT